MANEITKYTPGSPPSVHLSPVNPLDWAKNVGDALYESGMYKLPNRSAGRAMAMMWLLKGRDPFDIIQRYHFIDGKFHVRSDVMLADFRKHGGQYKIIERSPERAAVELKYEGNKLLAELTWEDAEKEPYTRTKDGGVKHNYATPRARMQMLFWRAISDGVSVIMPEVTAGTFEVDDPGTSDTSAIDVEAVADGEAKAATFGEPEPETANEETPFDVGTPDGNSTTNEQMEQFASLGRELGWGDNAVDDIARRLADHKGAASLRELSSDEMDEILFALREKVKAKRSKSELDAWAANQLGNEPGRSPGQPTSDDKLGDGTAGK